MICCIEEDLPVISRMFSSCCHTLFITSLGLLLVRRHVIELAERGHAWIHQVELTQISASLHLLEEDTHNAWQGAKCKRSPKTPTICMGYTSCD